MFNELPKVALEFEGIALPDDLKSMGIVAIDGSKVGIDAIQTVDGKVTIAQIKAVVSYFNTTDYKTEAAISYFDRINKSLRVD